MLAALGNRLVCGLFNLLRSVAVPVHCPECRHHFKPFADHTFTHVSEIMGRFPCPKCSHRFAIGEDAKSAREDARFNPPGPLAQPGDSRIERRTPSEHELLFYIPPAGRAGVLIILAMIWNAFMLPFFYFVVLRSPGQSGAPPLSLKLFITVFAAVGLGIAYAALRQKYAAHLLYLSHDLVRMQRRLLFRSTFDLKPAEILHVKLVLFYAENHRRVNGIEINAGMRQIRFGSALLEKEKQWLAWEIREFLRNHGATQLPEENAQ